MKDIIRVTAAIIIDNNKILIAKRKSTDKLSNKWEFPGGKIEDGETEKECLKREIKEEFEIDIEVKEFFKESTFFYPDLNIQLLAYLSEWKNGKINSTSHDSYKWITINNIDNFDFAEADKPIVLELKKYLNKNMS